MSDLTLGEKAEIALRLVREADVIAYDTETSGLDWKRNHPIGYVVSTGDVSVYVPIRHNGGGNLAAGGVMALETPEGPFTVHPFEEALAKAFTERRQHDFWTTVGHNLIFDMHFSANAGIYLGRNCEDTQLNEALLDEFSRSYSLDSCAKTHKVTAKLGDELYAHMANMFGGEPDRKQMGNYWRLPGNDDAGMDYAEGDGISTFELRHAQLKDLQEDELSQIHDIESRLIWTIFRMERRGIKIDAERMAQVKTEIATQMASAERMLPPRFNVRSGPQVKVLMEQAGHTDWPTTKLGNPSFNEKWLKSKPKGAAVVRVRKLTNLMNSFITPLEERHVYHGRVHAQLNQLKSDEFGTISGRFSCSNPNLQQVPKRDKELGPLFRSIFIPDDGMEFVEADYSQCEPRLFAHYSKEPALVDGYNQNPPLDMHHVVAEALNVERDPTAKRMNMGILTGMQVYTFAGHMDWSIEQAQEKFSAWFDAFPGIRTLQDQAKTRFKTRGFVKTLLGRRCRLESARYAYRAVSRIIQGGNADVIKYKLLQCDEYIEGEGLDELIQLLMTIHDSIAMQALQGERGRAAVKELVRICCDVQGPPFNLRVPFIMDVGIGPNWAIATYGDKSKEFD